MDLSFTTTYYNYYYYLSVDIVRLLSQKVLAATPSSLVCWSSSSDWPVQSWRSTRLDCRATSFWCLRWARVQTRLFGGPRRTCGAWTDCRPRRSPPRPRLPAGRPSPSPSPTESSWLAERLCTRAFNCSTDTACTPKWPNTSTLSLNIACSRTIYWLARVLVCSLRGVRSKVRSDPWAAACYSGFNLSEKVTDKSAFF